MPDYRNGKIYKLTNSVDDEFYIGSTCGTLHLRKNKHRSAAKLTPNRAVYEHLNRIGWENVRIILIENVNCSNKNELLRAEQHFIDLLKPSLNKNSTIYRKCPHNKRINICVECNGVSICQHNKIKCQCKICEGSAICKHNKYKNLCKLCDGSRLCQHNKHKDLCKICVGSQICEHNKRNYRCKLCNIDKFNCDYCNISFCGKSALKLHLKTKKHKHKFIQVFKDVFDEDLTMEEAERMGFE
jgi:hypothetical protein